MPIRMVKSILAPRRKMSVPLQSLYSEPKHVIMLQLPQKTQPTMLVDKMIPGQYILYCKSSQYPDTGRGLPPKEEKKKNSRRR